MTIKGDTWLQKTNEEYAKAIEKAHGNLSKVSRMLGVSRNTVGSRINHHPELKELVNNYRDIFIDELEDVLYEGAVTNKNPNLIVFALKTIGKARGYGENQEITLNKGQDESEYDLSQLTEEERGQLEQLTAKIYKPKLIEEENSGS